MSADDGGSDSFERLLGKVRRLRHDTVLPERPRPSALPRRLRRDAPLVAALPADEAPPAAAGESADSHHDYHRPGVQLGVLRKLRRGQFPVQDEIDLHGLTVAEAGLRLANFLAHARGRRLACIRIVHGKGLSSPGMRPVLKPQVARWLRQHPGVLAFTPARAHDGGAGATYVLLRSRPDRGP